VSSQSRGEVGVQQKWFSPDEGSACSKKEREDGSGEGAWKGFLEEMTLSFEAE
jgi:hypothetical protein